MSLAPSALAAILVAAVAAATAEQRRWTVEMEQPRPSDKAEPAGRKPPSEPGLRRGPNRLAKEASPYLLQHADNPVDWHPWGEAAFEKARREDKPIFLSIGYSTCHWCHVMERESFEDPGVAESLNRHFVPVKVDREERPDVDKIYMTAANGVGWGGGWPLNLWLTPELKPFYGGTYFPPRAKWGRPGLLELAERIGELWKTRKAELAGDADKVAEALSGLASVEGREAALDEGWLAAAFQAFERSFDESFGGFGDRPKFPMPVNQNFLLRWHVRSKDPRPLELVLKTLRELSKGGVYDHVGGGFHRYAVDGEWRVPHFEKMLYDNAQLAVNLLEAYQLSKDRSLAGTAAETLEYVLRDMTHGSGGFFSAEDADSAPPERASEEGAEKSEGAFYLWTAKELDEALGPASEAFKFRYGVRPEGNALEDPQGEFRGRNILFAEKTVAETAARIGRTEAETRRTLAAARKRLLERRSKRPRPHLDDKVLASWNGLMISAFAKGWQTLEEPAYLKAAQNAAAFLRKNLYDEKARRLYHVWRDGRRAVPGLADDYAFVVQGLLDLFEADFDPGWLEWALELTEQQNRLFLDPAGGLFMTAEDHDRRLIARVKEDSDNVEPAASSVAALNLLRLAQFTDRDDLKAAALKTIEAFGAQLAKVPRSLPQMLVAADFALSKPKQIVVAGPREDPGTREMLRAVGARFLPGKILVVAEDGPQKERLAKVLPFVKNLRMLKGKATAYVCVHYACDLPTTDLAVLADTLDGKPPPTE